MSFATIPASCPVPPVNVYVRATGGISTWSVLSDICAVGVMLRVADSPASIRSVRSHFSVTVLSAMTASGRS